MEKNLEGVPKTVIDVTNTGYDEFDSLGLEYRHKWIMHANNPNAINNYVSVTANNTVHLIEQFVKLINGEKARHHLCGRRANAKKVHVEDLDLSKSNYCKDCLKTQRKLAGAKKATYIAQQEN